MIDNEFFIKEQKQSLSDRFAPKIKLYDKSFSQKDLSDSECISPEYFEDFQDMASHQEKSKQRPSKQTPQIRPRAQWSEMQNKQNQFKKLMISQNYIKIIAQKLIDQSQVLQTRFKNNDLLIEQYLSGQSFKILNQSMKIDLIHLPVIQLNNITLKFWELIKLIVYFLFMWWMPYKGAFIINKGVDIYEQMLLFFILMDIILQINKEIIVQGQLIKDRKFIIQYYLKTQFILDLFYLLVYCCIIFQLISYSISQALNIIFFFFNLKKFQLVIQNYQESSISINDKINLVELILTVLILAHFMACIWFSVGITSLEHYNYSWILKLDLENEQVLTQYCYSFYWAATTMVTVGYGDITAQNLNEVICSFILIFFSSGIFAFTINSIGVILNNINQSQSFYKRSLLLINQHMDSNEVSTNLQNKIRNYLKFYYQSSHSSHEKDVDTVVEQLSQNLREELINDIRSKVVVNNAFLRKYFSKQTQQKLIQNLQQINFTPQEQIYEQMANDDHSFYIIQKGQVKIIDKNSGRIILHLTQGDSFGEIEMLTECPRQSQAYSVGFTKLLKISRANFISIIKQDQRDFEQFHMLKDQIIFKLKSSSLCRVCFQSHQIYDCNKLFYKPNLERVIKKELFHSNQERKNFSRQQKYIFKLSHTVLTQQRCQSYRYDNDIEIYQDESDISNQNLSSQQNSTNKVISSLSQFKYQFEEKQDKHSDQSIQNYLKTDEQQQVAMTHENQKYTKKTIRPSVRKSVRQSIKPTARPSVRYESIQQKYAQKQTQVQTPIQINRLYSINDENQDEFIELDIDKPKIYKNYFILNNLSNVILQYDKYLKKTQKEKYQTTPSNYRFFQIQKQKVLSSRHRLK